ncbi:acetyl-CoA carboxylase biotin carboxyl carrier protein [uncultured Helicobacter sp.]|uniref:acetyl-CoA carboxylase biotin carboxyl carrier protein n=1 Tax=uncultured Helicobacter sp. TaxID=175537 RepID=UPI001C3A5BCC|nr:acetyl-CoA carboxylase biotin carboxyl carrier protein [Candidatus Helicobacter avicola]
MNLQEIKKLMEIFGNSQIAKLNLKDGEFELKLEKYTSPAPVSTPQVPLATPALPAQVPQAPVHTESPVSTPQAQGGDFITSPMVGTFYRCPSPGAAPYINVGDTVKKGQTIGIIEAMKIMNEIEAECDCKILSIEVDDATPVEFSTNLVRIQKL